VGVRWGPITERILGKAVILDVRVQGYTLCVDGQLLVKIQDLVNRGWFNILLNLRELQYIDGEGLSEIVHGLKAVGAAGGTLALCNVAPRIRDLSSRRSSTPSSLATNRNRRR
jgi:hypothetical protein